MGESAFIHLDNLSTGYGSRVVTSGICARADAPGVIALIGPNGAGKSTLLKTICGELRPLAGSVEIMGKELSCRSRRELATLLSLVTAGGDTVAGGLTVEEVVALGRHPFTGFFGRLSASDREIVDCSMRRVGIIDKRADYVGNLSDGERQKAMIARALAQQTPVILLDEPFSYLDPTARIEIFRMLRQEALSDNKLIILSTHDVSHALRMADILWMTARGHFSASLPAEAVRSGALSRLFPSRTVEFREDWMDFAPKSDTE